MAKTLSKKRTAARPVPGTSKETFTGRPLPKRVVVERVLPQINDGVFPIKRAVGEKVAVEAHVLIDGHDAAAARLLYRRQGEKVWHPVPMTATGNDVWRADFSIDALRPYLYTVQAWPDRVQTWQDDLGKKHAAGQDIGVDIGLGVKLLQARLKTAEPALGRALKDWIARLTQGEAAQRAEAALSPDLPALTRLFPDAKEIVDYERELEVCVERAETRSSAWYELFPRSTAPGTAHGTFRDCEARLADIAKLGFDVVYLPPIHPIGTTNRKGKNNALACGPEDPGSPWAVGAQAGGHKAVHPGLGTLADFRRFVGKARGLGLDVAVDLAFQCSPDHPYVKEHPEWFAWRPDGSIRFAENPPKKYEDIVPFDFETDAWEALWKELKSIVEYWIDQGIRLFRVDNPHTKPFAFWQWLIGEIRAAHPDVLFLAEAFTRPKVMYRLAKAGFSASYTYFTWRTTKQELTDYLTELTQTEVAEYFRPHFWPNTPDILPEHLQYGGRPMFLSRLVLAATLSANYGVYGPAYELCVARALPGREEYADSEKYEIKDWDLRAPGNIRDFIARVNKVRRENAALRTTRNLRFCPIDNDNLIAYLKATDDLKNVLLVAVNLDPFHTQSGWLTVPLASLGIDGKAPYLAHDLLSGDKYIWHGARVYIELNPQLAPAHILRLHRRLHREQDFDYFT
ncbi:MAG: alpha-1,4-glucan--maltose-1-phosphate maltosyltransferase [Deltaproteobacteria bacterium]